MAQFSDWMIVGAFTFGIGITGSLTGQVSVGLLGSTTGAVIGAAVSGKLQDKRQHDTVSELDKLKKLVATQEELTKLNQQVAILQPRVEDLQKEQAALAPVKGQYQEKLAALKQIHQNLTALKQQEQELESRIAVINQKKPDLSELEKLQQQIEKFKIDKSGLEGQINALNSQVKSLESQKVTLQNVESELAGKQISLDNLNIGFEKLQNQAQQLEQRATEVELLRVTYDGLLGEKENFETRVNQLKPEIERLEAEKQRTLQAIQESQNDYHKVEELRRILHNLKITIRDHESELRQSERETQHLQGLKAALEENNALLQVEKQKLEEIIKRFKGEITEIENSAKLALQSLRENLWQYLPDIQLQLEETEFIRDFISNIQSQGLTFSTRVINAFHTSLKVQDISALAILAGISGTGKSELPQRYANYIGAQLLTLAVQPRWDSPQDLQGFYNYVEKKFKPTDLMRGLYQYNHDPKMQDRMVIVLLDEMNLARVEYYFSEFLSKLESRRNHATYLEIDVGSLRISENERRLKIPNEFLFVGTMNEDETTQTLSDKVLDRANVLTFGKPQNLKLRQEKQNGNSRNQPSEYLPYSHFQKWVKTPDPNSELVKKVKDILNHTNEVMEKLGHPFAHRVYQAITQYVVNYPGVENINSSDFKFAIADQFGQKLLPKLRGVMVDEASEELDELEEIISEIDDKPLITAFKKARKGRYGQFSWQGLVYEDEQVS
ncbi:AAA family ATPase [Dolichospermum sp. LEGE 00246]|uniref:AAA family ATPase n=1 Tax=Dolichospermum sp. LEGE 00246 TaxID=1828605 RepID=UPI00187E30C5|nr:AAA family ATPase [Dolichospermum sp. LEGE 00246]MBE9257720.1 AAA family ATPase [Dolichospermum sp. LEGE 00246]